MYLKVRMAVSLHHLKEMLFRRACHTISLETDAYADVQTHHYHSHISFTTGNSLSIAHGHFSLGSVRLKKVLATRLSCEKLFLNKAYNWGTVPNPSGDLFLSKVGKTKLARSKKAKPFKMLL